MIDFNALKAPFPPEKISWRVGSVTKDGKKAMALAYVDARDVMERLDDVCKPYGWQRKYSHANGKTVCDLGIKCDDEWVWKADGAGDSDIEAEKGALSDAFKRSAVNWGIARYLYDMPAPWVSIDEFKRITEAELERLRKFLPNAGPHLNVGLPGLSKTPAKFWDKPKLTLELPKNKEDEPEAVQNKWMIDNFIQGVNKAPSRELLAKFQADNKDWIDLMPESTISMLYEECAVRADQFNNH